MINPLERIIENIENKPINEPTIEKPKAIHFKEDTFYTGIEGEQAEQKSSTFLLPDGHQSFTILDTKHIIKHNSGATCTRIDEIDKTWRTGG